MDKNAGMGIFYSFKHNYKHGCLPREYSTLMLNILLQRRKRKVYRRKSESDDPINTKPHKKQCNGS